jgi:hypothetical protein
MSWPAPSPVPSPPMGAREKRRPSLLNRVGTYSRSIISTEQFKARDFLCRKGGDNVRCSGRRNGSFKSASDEKGNLERIKVICH